jgi:uncharacterized protein YodC (DUF2158 family)
MAKAAEFSVGQLVKLKSGGPNMTVEEVFGPDAFNPMQRVSFRCQWFAGKKLDSGVFPPESLMLVQPDDAQ